MVTRAAHDRAPVIATVTPDTSAHPVRVDAAKPVLELHPLRELRPGV